MALLYPILLNILVVGTEYPTSLTYLQEKTIPMLRTIITGMALSILIATTYKIYGQATRIPVVQKPPTKIDKPMRKHLSPEAYRFCKAHVGIPTPIATEFSEQQEILEKEADLVDLKLPKEDLKKQIDDAWNELKQSSKASSSITKYESEMYVIFQEINVPAKTTQQLSTIVPYLKIKPPPPFLHIPGLNLNCTVIVRDEKQPAIAIDADCFSKDPTNPVWAPLLEHERCHIEAKDLPGETICKSYIMSKIFKYKLESLKKFFKQQEKRADIFAFSQSHITLPNMIAFRNYIAKTKDVLSGMHSCTHPGKKERLSYLNKMIEAYKRDIKYSEILEGVN